MFQFDFGIIAFWAVLWAFHLIPSLLIALPIWIKGRRRVSWCWCDYALIILPFTTWALLMNYHDAGKSLANLTEGIWLGCLIPVAAIVRIIAVSRKGQRLLSFFLLLLFCLIAVGLWYFVPTLPE